MLSGLESCEHAIVPRSVLIVDDHAGFRRMARALLEAEGFACSARRPMANPR
jgi:hypothetical protein